MGSKEKFNFMEFMTQDKPQSDKPPQEEEHTEKPASAPEEERPARERKTPVKKTDDAVPPKKQEKETEKPRKAETEDTDDGEKETKPKKINVHIFITESDMRKIEYLASKLNMSYSGTAEQMLHKGLEVYEEANGPIPEKERKKNRKANKKLF